MEIGVAAIAAKKHPRVLADEGDWDRVRALAKADDGMWKMLLTVRSRAQEICQEPVIARELVGPRMIQCAQRGLKHVLALAITYKLSKEKKFARRCEAEMSALADFPDWNPGHFLDTGEIMLALAVGYDWLFDELSPASRRKIETALVEKGIKPGMAPGHHWENSKSNWSSVCYGGMAAAAIAIADVEPELAEKVLAKTLEKLPLMCKEISPDGAWPAGPTYWLYAMEYLVTLIALLEKATGSAHGLDKFPGFEKTGQYLCDMTTPTGGFFCYTDGDNKREMAIAQFWLAARFDSPEWLAFEKANLHALLEEYLGKDGAKKHAYRLMPLAMLWFAKSAKKAELQNKSALYRGDTPVAVLRNGSGDIYVGVKGGYPASDHGHMDVGSFLIEAGGVRWGLDLGREDYGHVETHGVPGLWNSAQDSDRWRVFRIGPHGHSICRFGHGLQNVKERADFTQFDGASCAIDLSKVYAGQVGKIVRAVKIDGAAIVIEDAWSAATADYHWQMITAAEVAVSGNELTLRQAGKTLTMKVSGDVSIRVEAAAELCKPHDSPHPGVKRVSVTSKARDGNLRVVLGVHAQT
jgi:hypothetical protein